MKKTILKAAVATALIVPTMVMAEATVYGNVHVSINQFDDGTAAGTGLSSGDITALTGGTLGGSLAGNTGSGSDELDMTSNTSSLGVKGSEDLGDGMKAIYKAEFQLDPADNSGGGNALTQRDMWVGLKGGMGTVKFGIMSSNYKQMGGKVDGLYRTQLQGRGFLNTQSAQMHGGRGDNRGRQTNTVQYASPKMGGIQLVANTTVSGSDDETNGVGVRYATKNLLVYVDFIDGPMGLTELPSGDAITESAVKVGGKFKADAFFVAAQYEDAADRTGYDYIHLNGGFNIDKNNAIIATYGVAESDIDSVLDTAGLAIAYNHKLSKMTNVYVGYGDRSSDTIELEDSLFTAGIKKKF